MAKIVEFLVSRSRKKYSVVYRTVATVLGSTLVLGVLPALVYLAGKVFMSGPLLPGTPACVISGIFFVMGIPWLAWSVFWQLNKGKGTPVPVVPTKNFLQDGPYRFARNPMTLGYFFYYFGWAFCSNRWGSLAAAATIVILYCLEIKFIEERELTERFGEAYRQYKKETPFIIPKFK